MPFLIASHDGRPADDPIFALNAEAKARAQTGESIVNATVGSLLDDDGKLATLEGVVEAVRETPPQVVAAYAPIAGSGDFLKGVTADLLGDRPEAKWVASVATPGGSGALKIAISNFIDRDQALLTSELYWGPYKTIADESDRRLVTFRMFQPGAEIESGVRAVGPLDLESFRRELESVLQKQKRALVLLNSPCNNPTGYSFDASEWRRLRTIVEELSSLGPITVCLDVAYARFGAQPLDVMVDEMVKLAGKALVLFAWSASKTFLEYGLRVGALVAVIPDEAERRAVQSAFVYSCRGTWSNVNAGGMAAISRVLNDPERRARVDAERKPMVELLARRVARFNELASAARLVYPRYDGGFFTTVFVKDAFGAAAKLKAAGVFVVPVPGALRIALCSVAERDIPRLVDSIVAAIA
ncbi:MAG: aminotransferase class I/II-fold pyridoxal phosphate-dependent enzyme [Polyangiaceae bacterium]